MGDIFFGGFIYDFAKKHCIKQRLCLSVYVYTFMWCSIVVLAFSLFIGITRFGIRQPVELLTGMGKTELVALPLMAVFATIIWKSSKKKPNA